MKVLTVGSIFYEYWSCGFSILAIVASGVHFGWPSPSLPKLQAADSSIPITADEGFWLATLPLCGALLGSLTTPFLIEIIGRHKTILLTSVPYITSSLLTFFATNVPVLYVSRFICGISDGMGFSSIPIYIGEISHPKRRGMFASSISVSFILGILIVNVVGSYVSVKNTSLILGAIPVVMVLGFVWMPESPYFYLLKGNSEGARKSLEKFRGPNDANSELNRIEKSIREDLAKKRINPLQLFTVKRNRKAVYVMLLCRGIQQFSGNSAIVFYTQNIFHEAGSFLSAELSSIIFFSTQLIVTCIASVIVDKTGRKPLIMVSIAGSGVTLLMEGIYFYIKTRTTLDVSSVTYIPVATLILYIIFFSVGLQNVPIIVLSEIFNQDVKAIGMCFADLYFSLIAAATSKYFQFTRDSFGMFMPFISFAVCCAVAFVLIGIIVPETKGKTLEEIQDHFKGIKLNKSNNVEDKII